MMILSASHIFQLVIFKHGMRMPNDYNIIHILLYIYIHILYCIIHVCMYVM